KTKGNIMKTSVLSLLTLTLLLIVSTVSFAETRYVTDQLVITVRSNKTNNYEILTTLRTASPVKILEEGAEYLKVRTSKGIEGYVRKQYVSKAIPKKIQIEQLQQQRATLESQLQQQRQEFQEKSGLAMTSLKQLETLGDELKTTRLQLEQIKSDYDKLKKSSDNVVNLATERDQLLEENSRMTNELVVLQEENRNFHRSNMIQWFLAGGGVFLIGWLIGKISRKKRGYGQF
ncbi:MAG: TIGR04211 family SH3 domain-containing protein, partial [Desulfuromonadales bacterium]|nr:TIGR04211 family SH3 domain-containing protein [Desulfuromonadales bacterium]